MALNVVWAMVKRGAQKGIKTTLELAKIVLPTSIAVTILRASGVLTPFPELCAPLMGLFGLSGDAALVLISGYFVNYMLRPAALLPLGLPSAGNYCCRIMLGSRTPSWWRLSSAGGQAAPSARFSSLRVGVSLLSGLLFGRIL